MALDLVKNFGKYEKQIVKYLQDRKHSYFRSLCRQRYLERVSRLNASWDMEIAGTKGGQRRSTSQTHFLGQLVYPLVKEQILVRRSIFSSNYRADPLFSFRAIGNTPDENAINMQDLLESNNLQIKFRPRILIPGNDAVAKYGAAVVYTEYCHDQEEGWRTVADPVFGSRRLYGIVKNTKNAQCYTIPFENYFQNDKLIDCDESDFRGHIERWQLSKLINKVKSHPELYIKENVEKVVKQVKQKHGFIKDIHYTDLQGRETINDYAAVAINDVARFQTQINLEDNEDDPTYYYAEMIGDEIIRFQDNPYDMNMNQYTILTCEPRREFVWGNTPPEYSIQNENAVNLLNGLGLENALESMKRYIFYNKNAINPGSFQHAAFNSKIAVDVNKDINLANILYQFQPQDTALPAIEQAYRRIMENNQRVVTTPDLNRAPSAGGPTNQTAYAANIMAASGNTQDADLIERLSTCWAKVGEKESIILAQHLGNWGPILIRPAQSQFIREVQKSQITGNWSLSMDTSSTKNNPGEVLRYQNMVTWLLNLMSSGQQLPVNIEPMVRQVLKMGEILQVDKILPEQQAMQQQPGYTPSAVMPGQEMAGAGQEMGAQMQQVAGAMA